MVGPVEYLLHPADEADRMLDMGILGRHQQIVKYLPKDRPSCSLPLC